ncbi:MAG TPA: M42 family metallopeptidase [Armatimonadota bacterium]|nr:M42 family metallopeptidase [Armatimonadota bacterium]
MRRESLGFLEELVNAPSPSGFEQRAQSVVRDYVGTFAEEVTTDVMGNVIAVVNPGAKPRVMLAGHCDEIGFMVRYITDQGFIHFSPIGGVDAHLVPGQKVHVHTAKGPILGVVGKKAIHLMEPEERKKVLQFHQQWIDIGVPNRKEAEKRVSVGDPVTFAARFERLNGHIAVARGFDDKMGSFVVIEALRLAAQKKLTAAVFAVSTVQEEIGSRGAATSAFAIDPDVAIAVDVTHATDYPEADKKRFGETKLGGGPVLHRGANMNPVITERLTSAAKKARVGVQMIGVPGRSGTDAWAMQLVRGGVASSLVSVPLRYMHTPIEVLDMRDLEAAAKVLATFCADLSPDTDFVPR